MTTNEFYELGKVMINQEKQRLEEMLKEFREESAKNLIETLQQTITKAEERFEREMETAKKYEKYANLYDSYIESAKRSLNTIIQFV